MALLFAASCQIDGDYQGTRYSCPDGRCPSGFECVDGKCLVPGAADASSDAQAAPDAPASPDASCACESISFADSCAGGAQALEGVRSAGGETICATTAFNTNQLFGCNSAPKPGLDAVFRVALNSGERLSAELRPEGFDGAIYIVTSCSTTVCEVIADDEGIGGTETLELDVPETQDYFLVVDSGSGAGCYRLHVTVE